MAIVLEDLVDGSRRFRAGTAKDGRGFQVTCACGHILTLRLYQLADQDDVRMVRCEDCGRSWEWELKLAMKEMRS